MRQRITRTSRPIGWALILALAAALSVNCLMGTEMTEAQKACCEDMGQACGPVAQEQHCCLVESQRVQAFATAKRVSLPPPVTLIGPRASVPDAAHLSLVLHPNRFDRSAPNPPGVPTYLLVSALLI
jgi:hypothetical protein